MSETTTEIIRLPLLALRGLNVFPGMLLTFDVERAASIGALTAAGKRDQIIFLAAQKDISVDLPEAEDIYAVGTVCRIRQQLRQPQGGMCRVMVEGLYRAEADRDSHRPQGLQRPAAPPAGEGGAAQRRPDGGAAAQLRVPVPGVSADEPGDAGGADPERAGQSQSGLRLGLHGPERPLSTWRTSSCWRRRAPPAAWRLLSRLLNQEI